MNCLLLHTIVLPDALTSIGDDAFNTTGLTSVIIPKNVSHIGPKAFLYNKDLEQLTILCTLDTLYSETFYRCDFLKEVVSKSVIPPSGNSYCFSNTAYSNARLTVPFIALDDYRNTEPWRRFSNVVSSDNAFVEVDSLYFVKTGESTVSISLYTGNQSILSIPSTIIHDGYTYTVTGIESFAFNKCTTLERVEMPNTITAIGNAAFRGCKRLKSITLSDNITVIGNSAFEECSQLATIDIPNSVTSIGEATFRKCVSLININLPESITTIGNSTFEECSQLATIDIPHSVTGIGEAAFKKCIALSNIDLPESILTISNDAFYGSGLTEAVIPGKVTHIGQKSFAFCSHLSSVTIQSVALSTIGDHAFNNTPLVDINCYSETPPVANANCFDSNVYTKAALMVPDKVKALYKNCEPWKNFIRIFSTDLDYIIIDDFSFTQISEQTVNLSRYSGNDEAVIVPESIEHDNATLRVIAVDDIAFCYCDNIKSVTLPNTITTIGRTAFWGCSSLEEVTLGQAITVIEDRAFEGCSSLKHIDIPSSVTRIGDKAFKDCKALSNLTIRSDSLSIGEECFANLPLNIVICMASEPPSTGSNCFRGSQRYATLCVPQTSIDLYKSTSPWYDFYNILPIDNYGNSLNDGLLYTITGNGTVAVSFFFGAQDTVRIPETITINDSIYRVTGIQIGAFDNRDINSLVIPRSIEYFESDDFSSFLIENLIIQDIDAWCMIDFLGFYSNPTTYCNHVFIGDEEMKDVTLSNKVKQIKPLAFSYINSLQSINLSDSVETISYGAFLFCPNLKRVHLGQSVQSIEMEAFCYCRQLESINIPKSLTHIGYQAFIFCPITHVEIEDLATWCDFNEFWFDDESSFPFAKNWHLYHDGQEIMDCAIPEGVTSIKPFSFFNCISLKKITLPPSLRTIFNGAFEDCSELETIDLPDSLKTILYRAFNLCPSMKKVISRSTVPPVISNANAFSAANYADAVLYVPSEAIEAYRNAEHWNRFTHIRPLDLHGDVNSDDEITVADINALLDALPTSEVTTRLDINGDGEVNIADVNALIDMILSGVP